MILNKIPSIQSRKLKWKVSEKSFGLPLLALLACHKIMVRRRKKPRVIINPAYWKRFKKDFENGNYIVLGQHRPILSPQRQNQIKPPTQIIVKKALYYGSPALVMSHLLLCPLCRTSCTREDLLKGIDRGIDMATKDGQKAPKCKIWWLCWFFYWLDKRKASACIKDIRVVQ